MSSVPPDITDLDKRFVALTRKLNSVEKKLTSKNDEVKLLKIANLEIYNKIQVLKNRHDILREVFDIYKNDTSSLIGKVHSLTTILKGSRSYFNILYNLKDIKRCLDLKEELKGVKLALMFDKE